MKTIEEAATEHVKTHFTGQFVTQADPRESFNKGVEFAQRWIPVEEEMPENVEELIGNNIKSENVLVERTWDDNGEIAIEVNCRFRPSERIGFLWNIDYKGSKITRWRPIELF